MTLAQLIFALERRLEAGKKSPSSVAVRIELARCALPFLRALQEWGEDDPTVEQAIWQIGKTLIDQRRAEKQAKALKDRNRKRAWARLHLSVSKSKRQEI